MSVGDESTMMGRILFKWVGFVVRKGEKCEVLVGLLDVGGGGSFVWVLVKNL